jgi:hypothetical protein
MSPNFIERPPGVLDPAPAGGAGAGELGAESSVHAPTRGSMPKKTVTSQAD